MSHIGFTHDISLSGVFVTAGTLPTVGQDLTVELDVPGGSSICFSGRVVRRKKALSAMSGLMPSGFGLGLSRSFQDYERLVSAL